MTVDVAGNSTFVVAYGFEPDIDTCEALYTSLVIQMVAASDAYLRSGRHRGGVGSGGRAWRRAAGGRTETVVGHHGPAQLPVRVRRTHRDSAHRGP